MGKMGRQSGWLAAVVLLLVAGAAAQIQLGENTQLSLSGNASFGYNGVFSDVDSNQVVFGGNADLTGSYYNPKFLSFRVSPYYNQSRLNSDFNSIFSSKGLTAAATLFGGSHTPIDFSYERTYDSEGTVTVPGSLGYATNGSSQGFSIGGGLYFEGFPTLRASFSTTSDAYTVLGSTEDGSSRAHAFTVGSAYTRWGFNFNANYAKSYIDLHTPLLFDPLLTPNQTTNQDSFQVGASRKLWGSSLFSASYSHTHFVTDYANTLTDSSYDSLNGNFSWRPTSKLILGASANYTTNFGAYLLGTLLPAGSATSSASTPPPPSLLPLYRSSDFFTYGTRATYLLTPDITLDGSVDHTSENIFGEYLATTTLGGGGGYRHTLWGGQFSAHYGLSYYTSPTSAMSAMGHTGNVSYSHALKGWNTTGSFQYNTNVMTAVLGYSQSGYSLGVSASRPLSGWQLSLSAREGKSSINATSLADSLTSNYSAALSRNRFSINGSYGRNSGESLPMLNGLVPSPLPGPIIAPGLLIFYSGTSYAGGVSYQPVRRLVITGSYMHALYQTDNTQSISNNMVTRLDSRVEYTFRQMHILGSYTYLRQGVGADFTTPQTVNAIYFGVSRHFDLF